ncbi:MAG: hypothetical protein GEV07_21630 [Streptosporangiales bacterium]|nr:hypothetical protein [Streptosporangiales bacterium]
MEDASALVPGYDSLPLSELQHRVRSLDETELRTLVEYEQTHANRTGVLELLTARMDELTRGAEPSGGSQQSTSEPSATSKGSPVRPDTGADLHTPQRHGKPDQTPRRGRP